MGMVSLAAAFRSVLFGALLVASCAASAAPERWVATWASAQQVPEEHNALPSEDLHDATLRQVVRASVGGERIRVKLSNLFGTAPLTIGAVHVAPSADPASSRIVGGTGREVTFDGRQSVTIPAGAEYLSDPVVLDVPAMSHLAVSMYLPEAPARQTSHPGSRATSYFVHGNRIAAADLPDARSVAHWYQLAGVEIASREAAAIVAIGDSITDGFGVSPDTDERWTDFLIARLQADPETRDLALLNMGLGGNRVLHDGLGPNAASRFERDVVGRRGVRAFIILEGVNDLGSLGDGPISPEEQAEFVAQMTGAYSQMVTKAREEGIRAIGATIMPYGRSSHYRATEDSEAARQAINDWIRAPGNFDAVIDFDAIMRDPQDPSRLRAEVDNDGLHPSIEGYKAMAAAVPLALLKED